VSAFFYGSLIWFVFMLALGWWAAGAFDDKRTWRGLALVALIVAMGGGWFIYVWLVGEVTS
jgi:hypothetical protein